MCLNAIYQSVEFEEKFSPASRIYNVSMHDDLLRIYQWLKLKYGGMQQKEHAVHDQRWMDRWMEGMHDAWVDGTELQTHV